MIIDPVGLFHGDRLARCSNQAHLHFPFFLLASDGFARIELNYHRIVGRAFCRFNPPPSENDFWRFVAEYHNAGLLFVYSVGSKLFGMWDTPSKYLPRFKTAEDKKSPLPPEPDFTNWMKAVRAGTLNGRKTLTADDFRNPSEEFQSGVGVGVGVGVGKNLCASPAGDGASVLVLDSPKKPTIAKPTTPDPPGFADWWEAYPRKTAKKTARAAFQCAVRKHGAEAIKAGTVPWVAFWIARGTELQYVPYPATFLKGERYLEAPIYDEQNQTHSTRLNPLETLRKQGVAVQ